MDLASRLLDAAAAHRAQSGERTFFYGGWALQEGVPHATSNEAACELEERGFAVVNPLMRRLVLTPAGIAAAESSVLGN